jgi:indole-3-glycerol phosphate synthase
MHAKLARILEETRKTLPGLKSRARELEREAGERPAPIPFTSALRGGPAVRLIGEVKRRSPSRGEIRGDLDPAALATELVRGGASAISVLTDGPHFGGSIEDLRAVVAAVPVPVLRKDFIVDEAQVLEARAAGASALLLIARVLTDDRLQALVREAREFGLEAVVEAHSADEVDRSLAAGAKVIGINSRDLDTFAIDVEGAWTLLSRVPAGLVAVAESGMAAPEDVARAAAAGADAVLIGTALSSASEPALLASQLSRVAWFGRRPPAQPSAPAPARR